MYCSASAPKASAVLSPPPKSRGKVRFVARTLPRFPAVSPPPPFAPLPPLFAPLPQFAPQPLHLLATPFQRGKFLSRGEIEPDGRRHLATHFPEIGSFIVLGERGRERGSQGLPKKARKQEGNEGGEAEIGPNCAHFLLEGTTLRVTEKGGIFTISENTASESRFPSQKERRFENTTSPAGH